MARNGMGPKGWAWLDRCCWMPRWRCAGLGLYGCCCISLKSGSWLTGTPKEKTPALRNLWRLKCQEMPKASPYKCFAARHTEMRNPVGWQEAIHFSKAWWVEARALLCAKGGCQSHGFSCWLVFARHDHSLLYPRAPAIRLNDLL